MDGVQVWNQGRGSKPEYPARILLVDDDQSIRESVTDLLTFSGYDVHAEEDGMDAVRWLRSNEMPDLIVSDIMMQQMDGYQFYDAVRANPAWTGIPFVFLTARGQPGDIRKGTSLGADAYVTKPFEPEDLIVAVEARIRRMRQIQSATQADTERMKKNLVTVFSHELRTPLTYIYGYVNLLQDSHQEFAPNEIEDMLGAIRSGTDRLVKLTEDLMLLVQIDSGLVAMEIAHRRIVSDVNVLISEVLRDLSGIAQGHSVQFEIAVPDATELLCAPYYIEDALSRVIHNAIKFSARGSQVWITASEVGETIVITVQDTGIGMEGDQIALIFERFRQLNRKSLEQQGVGVGLTIAMHLIQLHRGTLEVESAAGYGTKVTITLPAKG